LGDKVRVAIVGSGPAGLSAAAHAAQRGMSHILLEKTDMPRLVADLASRADMVFIDVPPFALYPDAAAIAGVVDGVVLVVEADSTPVAVASRTVEAVRKAGGEVLGSVLNKRREYIPAAISELIA